ncbi:hypothetical protein R1sor_025113 [Riccia sorocarpa]|uniref:Uncharacterized protein n=1 Tax=Riccia sorocarpa TaxID=122646 RepID=A0ABD3G7N3_9MARC
MNIGEEDSKTALSKLEDLVKTAPRCFRREKVVNSFASRCRGVVVGSDDTGVRKKGRSSSNSITKSMFGVDEPELEGGKRKRASKAKSHVQVLPPEFLDHIDSARAYKEAKEARHSEVSRGHKHSKDVAPPTCDGGASLVVMSVPETVDDVIRLEKDQVPGSAGTGDSEAADGTEDPKGIDPEVRAEEAEEEVPEHEQNLGEEGIVPDSLVGE